MYKYYLRWLGVLITLLTLACLAKSLCQATVADLPHIDRTAIRQKIADAERNGTRFRMITGEVLVGEKGRLILRNKAGAVQEYFLSNTDVYLNGQPSSGEALRPVCPGRPFQVRLYLDEEGIVKIAEAWYIGGEGELIRLHPREDGRFSITLRALDTSCEGWFLVSQELNDEMRSIPPGTSLYYQLNLDGEIGYILVSP